MKMLANGLCHLAGNDGLERFERSSLDRPQTTKMRDEPSTGLRPDTGNMQQIGIPVAHLAPLAMVGNGEAMGFIPDTLHQMQNG